MTPALTLTSGLRFENFEAFDGSQCCRTRQWPKVFPSRKLSATSPKVSLAWAATDEITLRTSLGRRRAFPQRGRAVQWYPDRHQHHHQRPQPAPGGVGFRRNLRRAQEWASHWLRASVFRDDVADTILRQTDSTVFPSVTARQQCRQGADPRHGGGVGHA